MSVDEVGMKIAAFCIGHQLLLVGVYIDEDVDAIATRNMRRGKNPYLQYLVGSMKL